MVIHTYYLYICCIKQFAWMTVNDDDDSENKMIGGDGDDDDG